MGARSLESTLRRGVLSLAAPAIVVVGCMAVVVTGGALGAADRDLARQKGVELIARFDAELSEGDAPSDAADEVLASMDREGARATLRGGKLGAPRSGKLAPPASLVSLAGSACASESLGEGTWTACSVESGGMQTVVAVDASAHRAVVRKVAAWMFLVVGLALLSVVVATRRAVKKPLASLRALVGWSEKVALQESPAKAPAADSTEIAQLGRAFDALVTKLVAALDRERATSAHIAHELRTPLTSIRAELESMPAADAVTRALADVRKLAGVVDAILVLSSPSEPARGEGVVNLADIVRELASSRTSVVAPDEALLDADPRLVALAVRNLLENAEKHAGGAAREVRLTKTSEGARVAVIDDGPGVSEAAREKMFDRHWQASRGGGGSGLGLALVRAVAERYEGHAEALRNPGGRGLEVAITFGRLLEWHPGGGPEAAR